MAGMLAIAPAHTAPPPTPADAGKGGPGGEAAARRGAEALLCVLSIVEGVLSQLKHCEAGTLAELLVRQAGQPLCSCSLGSRWCVPLPVPSSNPWHPCPPALPQADIHQLINRHPFVQVLAGAAACLTTLASKDEGAARQLASTAAIYSGWLRDPGAAGAGGRPQLLCRFLYILGQLCRRGAGVLERTPPESGGPPLTLAECQRVFVQYCSSRENVKVGGDFV